jgi:alkylhydroperoxidase/carboxymuconolactone decarboxylase family protein YurZ
MSTEKYVRRQGEPVVHEMFGEGGVERFEEDMQKTAARVDAHWAHTITDWSTNGMYARGVIDTATRELCAIAALTVMQESDSLATHIRIALGIHPPEVVREVILQMAVLGGLPIALKSLRLFERVAAEVAAGNTEVRLS